MPEPDVFGPSAVLIQIANATIEQSSDDPSPSPQHEIRVGGREV